MLFLKAVEGYILDCQASGYSPATVALNHICLKHFVSFAGDQEIETITPELLKRFFVWLQTDYKPNRPGGNQGPLAPASIDAHWKAIRSFFRWGNDALGLQRPDLHIAQPKYKISEIVPFSQEDMQAILKSCEIKKVTPKERRAYTSKRPTANRDRAIILILLDTGMRIGELARLVWNDVDLSAGEIVIAPYRSSVKSRPRAVVLSKRTLRAIWKYNTEIDDMKHNLVFGLSVAALKSLIHRIGIRANVRDCHPHRFRHTFAILYLRNGGDVFTLQKLLGHSDLKMTQRYLYIVRTDLEAAHRRASPVDNWKL